MKKNNLKNGDIVVVREGELGLYLEEHDVIIYQTSGMDFLDDDLFNDDLTSTDGSDCDIMRVYRDESGPISFCDYKDAELASLEKEDCGKFMKYLAE